MYTIPADFYLSCLNIFAYLGLSVLSVVMQEVYGKQRSENTSQVKAVITVPSFPSLGCFGGQEKISTCFENSNILLCILIFGFKIKTCNADVNDAYWLSSHKIESSLKQALPWLKANAAIDHLINRKKIKGTVICCVSALLLSSWQSAYFCLEQRSVPWPCDLETLVYTSPLTYPPGFLQGRMRCDLSPPSRPCGPQTPQYLSLKEKWMFSKSRVLEVGTRTWELLSLF